MTDRRAADPFSLAGRVAIVTGAARGLGFEIARALAASGAHVVVNGRDAGRTAAAADAIAADGARASAAVFDVMDEAAGRAALADIAARHGRLDILVNNVGMRLREPIEAIDAAAFRMMLDADLVAPFLLGKAAAELMKPRRAGRIINVGSTQGTLARAGDAAYITAKGGILALSRALAAEYGPFGITCNTLAPGSFATDMNLAFTATPEGEKLAQRRTFLGRYGAAHEIAGAAVFLASDAASYVTGSTITVDGGWSAAF